MRRLLLQLCLGLVIAGTASAQFKPRKLGELELVLSGLSATVDPVKVTVPKNTASGVRSASPRPNGSSADRSRSRAISPVRG